MKVYLIISLLLISLCFSSCSSTKNFNSEVKDILQPLTGGNKSALYKVRIKVFDNFFSGLVLFKYNKDRNDYNIVLFTEVGLTLCEFYFVNNQMEIKKASSLFQSKIAQKTLAEDFGYLICETGELKQVSDDVFINSEKIRYTISAEDQVNRIRKRRLINGIEIDLENYSQGVPSSIKFNHHGIKFNMELSLLKVS